MYKYTHIHIYTPEQAFQAGRKLKATYTPTCSGFKTQAEEEKKALDFFDVLALEVYRDRWSLCESLEEEEEVAAAVAAAAAAAAQGSSCAHACNPKEHRGQDGKEHQGQEEIPTRKRVRRLQPVLAL
jgi:hypothetical protein